MECHFDALPCTPFCLFEAFHPQGSVSLDSRVASLPYESSSLATSRGNEKIGGTGYCVTYDTDSQSRNVLASPLGEEGHEVAKGWTRVRMIMILDVDVTAERRHYKTHRPLKGKRLTTFCASLRSGGRRLAVRKMIECHISAQPRTPFCHYVAFPLKGKREIWREKQASHILHVPFRCVTLWWLAPYGQAPLGLEGSGAFRRPGSKGSKGS